MQTYKSVTHLQYEYSQVAVYLLSENDLAIHCSMAVCIHTLSFFLYVKRSIVISKQGYKAQSCCSMYTLIGQHEMCQLRQ